MKKQIKRKRGYMQEIIKNLYIGSREDVDRLVEENSNLLHENKMALCLAAKTYHRWVAKLDNSNEVGYSGNMPKEHKEYLIAERPLSCMLAVNLIDAPIKFIPQVIIEKCLEFIDKSYNKEKRKVVILCDKGESRSTSIAFMWLMKNGYFNINGTFEEIETIFSQIHCPCYKPNSGMHEYAKAYYEKLKGEQNGTKSI